MVCIYVLQNFQFEEQKDQVTVERILRVVFVDPERPSAVSESMNTKLVLVYSVDWREREIGPI